MTQTWTRVSNYHELMGSRSGTRHILNTLIFPPKSLFSLVSHHNLHDSLFTGFSAWIRALWKSNLNFNLQSKCDGRKEDIHVVTPFPVRILLHGYIVCFRRLEYGPGNSINSAARSGCNRTTAPLHGSRKRPLKWPLLGSVVYSRRLYILVICRGYTVIYLWIPITPCTDGRFQRKVASYTHVLQYIIFPWHASN
jgi:hypothetical protein